MDPVIAADGTTYKKAAMERWLLHHTTSSCTGAALEHQRLVPNRLVKAIMLARHHESSKALAATTEARIDMCKSLSNSLSLPSIFALFCIGPDADPLMGGFRATGLDQNRVGRTLDACVKHTDHWSGLAVAAMAPWDCRGL